MRQELERRGIRVLQYVPDSTLMVASPVAPDLDGLEVLSASALEPSDKISPLLADQVAGALLVVFHPDVEMAKARDTVRARGFDVLENAALLAGHLVVSGPYSALGALAVRRSCLHRARVGGPGGGIPLAAALGRRPKPVPLASTCW